MLRATTSRWISLVRSETCSSRAYARAVVTRPLTRQHSVCRLVESVASARVVGMKEGMRSASRANAFAWPRHRYPSPIGEAPIHLNCTYIR